MPWTRAACWSSATARIAMPCRDHRKNTVNAASTTAATATATSRSSGTVAPGDGRPVPAGSTFGISRGVVPKNIVTTALRTAASPIVTMITAIGSSPISGRSTSRSIATPRTAGGRDADEHGDGEAAAATGRTRCRTGTRRSAATRPARS